MSYQKSQNLLSQLNELINSSVDSFNEHIPSMQRDIFNRVQLLLKDLTISRGKIKPTISNLRKINRLKREIQNAVLNDKYLKRVGAFRDSYTKVTELQTKYFASIESGFELPAFVEQLKKSSVTAMVEGLTGAGIKANITQKAADIVRRNITEGARFGELLNEMRTFLTKTETGAGALSRYAHVYTTDALNTYAAEYNQVVSDDLDSKWFQYTGALVEDSRDFCEALVRKRWIHISEFDKITKGNINGKTVSLAGLKPNTNAVTFRSKRGGWNCNHQVMATNEEFVPENIRKKFAD